MRHTAVIFLVALVATGALAGPAPEADPKNEPAPQNSGEWQVVLRAKVIEWSGQTDLDYGFSVAYWRDPAHPNSIVSGYDDGRGLLTDPDAFLTLPSQSHLDLGLRLFLDQMNAKNGSLEAVVEALEQQGDVKMLAEPKITLKKGAAKAEVKTQSKIPYASDQVAGVGLAEVTLFQDTGVVLSVGFDDVVELDQRYAKMKVTASVTSLAGYVSVSVDSKGNPRRVPQTNTRMVENVVLVRDKTTLIAGILKEDSKVSNAQGPPILGDIPLVKHLFRNRSSTNRTHEILFLIHVDLIPPGEV